MKSFEKKLIKASCTCIGVGLIVMGITILRGKAFKDESKGE